MLTGQPSWQQEPCPRWCVREHAEDDVVLDRYHQGAPTVLPVLLSGHPEEPRTRSLTPVDLTIRVGRYAGEVVDWVAIEPIEPASNRLVLTADSAGALAQRVSDQLARHAALDQT